MEFYCYIIFSHSLNKFYVGATSQALSNRIAQHNSSFFGNHKFTHKANDWELFLSIRCESMKQALAIEKHIKAMKNNKYIHNLKVYPDIITNLLENYSNS